MEGWIKLYRQMDQWQWASDPNMVALFVRLIMKASHQDTEWRGVEVKRGQVITGLHALSVQTGISVRSLRTCLSRLEAGGEITRKTTNKYSIITIVNYNKFQAKEECERQTSDKRATNKRQHTRSKEEKKKTYGQFSNVFLSDEEHQKLKERFNGSAESKIETLSEYIASHGKKYKSHYATILSWSRKDEKGKAEQGEWI